MLEKLQPSLVTQQGGGQTSWVWLNGKFRMKPWTQMVPEAPQSPLDLIEDEVSGTDLAWSRGYPASGIDDLRDVVDGYQCLGCYISSINGLKNQISLPWDMKQGG